MENKIVCNGCGKKWNVVFVKRERISSGNTPEAFDILDEPTLYVDKGKSSAVCRECGTVLDLDDLDK